MNWTQKLDAFGRTLLRELGYDEIPNDHNPVTDALKDSEFIERYDNQFAWFNKSRCRTGLSKAAVLCQMQIYDAQNGPEMDGRLAGLREHWYRFYKARFAQPLAIQLGDKMELNEDGVMDIDGKAWFGRMSKTYSWIVDSLDTTYKQLWVEDASRKMEKFYDQLFGNANIVLALEKDGMVKRFSGMAKALGAISIYSGKGKSGKAAIELLLRDHFGWSENWNPFSEDNPLVVIHITDYDHDGEIIGNTFAKQMRRYTEYVLEARVGIKPAQVQVDGGWSEEWYIAKMKNNSAYKAWANEKGLFWAKCDCGHTWAVMKTGQHECPECPTGYAEVALGGGTIVYGFEVEALYTKDYRKLLVDAYLSVVPFDYVVERLRDECQASSMQAASDVRDRILVNNASYRALLKEFDRLEEIKEEFERRIADSLTELGEPHTTDWRADDDDPTADDFGNHVHQASDWTGPWRPFDAGDRTAKLTEWLQAPYTQFDPGLVDGFKWPVDFRLEQVQPTSTDMIDKFEQERIEWK